MNRGVALLTFAVVLVVVASLASDANGLTLTQLRAQLVGNVRAARDAGYNDLRTGYNQRFSRLPAVIVSPRNVTGVQLALEYARTNNLTVTVRSGGHSSELLSVLDEAVVVDFSNMAAISIDAENKVAVVEPGMRWGAFYAASVPLGLGAPGGSCPGVGVGGSSLGGGANDLATMLGYSLDNVLAFQVVLANGSIVEASDNSHQDLFWALRGAGHGGLGVVTAVTLRLSPIEPTFYSIYVTYAWEDFEAILNHVATYSKTMPDEVNLYFTGWKSAAKLNVALSCFYNGPPSVGATVCSRFANATVTGVTPLSSSPTTESYAATVAAGTDPKGRRSFTKGGLLKGLSRQAVRAIRRALEEGPESSATTNTARLNLYWQGGKMLDQPRTAVAFVHRTYPWNAVWLASYVPDSMTDQYERWITTTNRRMRSYMSGETYNNYPDLGLDNWQWAYYAENYPRLRVIKSAYDPKELFKGPQTIEPADE
jgi:FAD/FMN-containing dehydrogenase